jgi:hypothetical protein
MKELFHMRVEQEDLKNWKAAAEGDGVSLSAWIRRRCEPSLPGLPTGQADKTPTEAPAKESLSSLVLRNLRQQKTCPHGKPKGYNCGFCGGLAKIE